MGRANAKEEQSHSVVRPGPTWPLLDVASPVTNAPRRPAPFLIGLLFAAALIIASLTRGLVLRSLLPLALAFAAVAIWWRARRQRGASVVVPTGPRLHLDGDEVLVSGLAPVLRAETAGAHASLGNIGLPFGVSLLTNRGRTKLTALVSNQAGTFLIGSELSEADRGNPAYRRWIVRALTVPDEDAALDAIGPTGEPIRLEAGAFADLLNTLEDRSPGCFDRLVLTDARGEVVRLDVGLLDVGRCRFDLSAPLEWRSVLFQEAFGNAVALYQGTWIRQSGQEVCLVALLPSIYATHAALPGAETDFDRAIARDMRLIQGSPDEPPPNEQRVAIDRALVLPLRAALDRVPRGQPRPNLMAPSG